MEGEGVESINSECGQGNLREGDVSAEIRVRVMRKWQLFGHLGKSVWGRGTSKCEASEKEMSSAYLSNQRGGDAAGAQADGGMGKERRVGKPGRARSQGPLRQRKGIWTILRAKGSQWRV